MAIVTKKVGLISVLILLNVLIAFGHNERSMSIGIGMGIQSYPSAIDPCEVIKKSPVFYPQIEMNIPFLEKVSLTSSISRTVIEGTLLGLIWCRQWLELYTTTFGFDYNFGSQKRQFKTGIQLLASFSEYGTRSYDDYVSSGLGIKVYACATRPLARDFSWGIRSGVQRLRIHILPSEHLNMDSFHIEIVGYFLL
jgi:hypothetical protein